MLSMLVVVLRPDYIAGLSLRNFFARIENPSARSGRRSVSTQIFAWAGTINRRSISHAFEPRNLRKQAMTFIEGEEGRQLRRPL